MRNPERIDDMLEILGKLWKETPDQRFFQKLENLFYWTQNPTLYHAEDDDLIKGLKAYYKKHYWDKR